MVAEGGSKNQDLVQQLLQAEKQAEEIINAAKKNRAGKIRQAKDGADEELVSFRAQEEQQFCEQAALKAAAGVDDAFKADAQATLLAVSQDYKVNKDKTIDFIVSKVLDVPKSLTPTQKESLLQTLNEKSEWKVQALQSKTFEFKMRTGGATARVSHRQQVGCPQKLDWGIEGQQAWDIDEDVNNVRNQS